METNACGVKNASLRRWLAVLLLGMGVVVPFLQFCWPMSLTGYRDEFYQALCVRDYANSPLAMLTFYIGHVWCDIFGESIQNLRILKEFCYTVSIALPCYYLYARTKDGLLSSFLFALLNLGAIWAGMNIYNWDTGAYPFIALTLVAVLWYRDNPGVKSIAVVGICTALMVLSRVPTLCLLPVLLCIIVYVNGWNGEGKRIIVRDSIVGLSAFVSAFVIVVSIMVGSPGDYIAAWNSDNIISGHSTLSMERQRSLSQLLWFMYEPVLFSFACCLAVGLPKMDKYLRRVLFAGVVVICAYVSLRYRHHFSPMPLGFFQAIFWILVLYAFWHWKFRRTAHCDKFVLLTTVVFAFAAVVGSDSVVERPLVISLMPLVVLAIYPSIGRAIRYFMVTICVCTAVISVDLCCWQMGQVSNPDAHRLDRYERLKGMYCWESEYGPIAAVDSCYRKYDAKDVLFVGSGKFFFDYILTDSVGYCLQQFHYRDCDSTQVLQRLRPEIGSHKVIIMAPLLGLESPTYVDSLLLSQGYMKKKDGIYCRP